MSIVISAVDCNRVLYVASDRRMTIPPGIQYDGCRKVYRLRPRVFFGMTGTLEPGLKVLEHLRKLRRRPLADVFKETERIVTSIQDKLSVMITGQDESGDFFIWQVNNQGEKKMADILGDCIAFSLSSTENTDRFASYLNKLFDRDVPVEEAIKRTIAYASKIDRSISPTYDLFKLKSDSQQGG